MTNPLSPTAQLTQALIQRPSITPLDMGCQQLISERLAALGFQITPLSFGNVDNCWAQRGQQRPLLVLAGHTDVVPTGPENQWQYPPFQATIADGYLHGRGAADMKGGLAAMVVACERFIERHPDHAGSIAFLLTSDEEGAAIEGTVKVVEWLQQQQKTIDWCILGEPSSTQKTGDTLKNGRRGSLSGILTVQGTQGHVAYPHLADNPIHRAAPALAALCAETWDHGNAYFPATTFQISNIKAGTGAENIIPGELEVAFNFRFSTENTPEQLKTRVETILHQHSLRYQLHWRLSGYPFLTRPGKLTEAVSQAVQAITGLTPELSTSGGTSDGRFIAPTGAEVVELGVTNASIHKINECVSLQALDELTSIYEKALENLLLISTNDI